MIIEVKKWSQLLLILVLFFVNQLCAHKENVNKKLICEKDQSIFEKFTGSLKQASKELSTNIGNCVSDLTRSVQAFYQYIGAKVVACADTLKYHNIISCHDNPLDLKPINTSLLRGERIIKGQSCTFLCPGIKTKQLASNVSEFSLPKYNDVFMPQSKLIEEKHAVVMNADQSMALISPDNTVDLSKRIDDVYAFIDAKMSSTVDLMVDKIATVFLSLDKKIKNLEVASDLGDRINQLDGGMKKMFKAVNDRINSLKKTKNSKQVSLQVKKLDDELRNAVTLLNKRLDTVVIKKGNDGSEVWDEVQSLNSYIEKIYITLNKKIEAVKTHATTQVEKGVTWSEINGLNSKVDMITSALNTKMKALRSEIDHSTKEESRVLAQSIEKISQNFEQNLSLLKSEVGLLAQQTSQVAHNEKTVVDQIQDVNTRVADLSKDLVELSQSSKNKEILGALQERVETLNNQVGTMKQEILARSDEQTNTLWNEIDGINNQLKETKADLDEKIDTKIKRIDTDVSVQVARVSNDIAMLQTQVNRDIIALKDESDRLQNVTLPHLKDLKKAKLASAVSQNSDQITIDKELYDQTIKEEVKKQLSSLRENTMKVKHVRKKQRLQKLLDYVLEKEDE